MRTIWNGTLSFGLVTIPVGLAPATKPKARQSDVSFRQLHRECGTPIKQKRWCPFHEREIGADSLVAEFDPGELTSDYRRDLRSMLEAKVAGEVLTRPEPQPETPAVDLMEALRRSVAEAQKRK